MKMCWVYQGADKGFFKAQYQQSRETLRGKSANLSNRKLMETQAWETIALFNPYLEGWVYQWE